MAFRREDDAHPLWHPAERRTLLRAHRTLGADTARHPAGHLRLDSPGVYKKSKL